MQVLTIFLMLLISVIVNGASWWVAAKITGNETPYKVILCIIMIVGIAELVPYIGFILSCILFFTLLKNWAVIDFWPDGVLIILISNILKIILYSALISTNFLPEDFLLAFL